MIENEELPIGFIMELGMHGEAMSRYAQLTEEQQRVLADGSRLVKSRDEMRSYVEHMLG